MEVSPSQQAPLSENEQPIFAETHWYLAWLLMLAFLLPHLAEPAMEWVITPIELRVQAFLLEQSFKRNQFPVRVILIDDRHDATLHIQLLKSTLDTLAGDAKYKPSCIGIDEDCSPTGAFEPTYLEEVRREARTASGRLANRVFLGVDRQKFAGSPENWLGADYTDLAACISLPNIREPYQPVSVHAVASKFDLPTMGTALARAYSDNLLYREGIQTRSFVGGAPKEWEDVAPWWYRVDYTCVQHWKEYTTIVSADRRLESVAPFDKEIVLLGFLNQGVDRHPDTMLFDPATETPVYPDALQGIYKHAAAAYTFSTRPLRDLGPVWRLIADTIIAAVGFVGSFLLWLRRRTAKHQPEYYELAVRLANAFLALAVAMLLIYYFRAIWTAFALAVLLPMLEPYLTLLPNAGVSIWNRVKGRASP